MEDQQPEKNDGGKTSPNVQISPSASIEFVPATLSSQQNNNNSNENQFLQPSDLKRKDSFGGQNNNSFSINAGNYGNPLSRIGSRGNYEDPAFTALHNSFNLVVAKVDLLETEMKWLKNIQISNGKRENSLAHPAEQLNQFRSNKENSGKSIQLLYKSRSWQPTPELLEAVLHAGNLDTSHEIQNGEKKVVQPVMNLTHLVKQARKDPEFMSILNKKIEKKRTFIQKNAHKISTGLTIFSLFSLGANYFLGKKADVSPLAWMPSLPSFVARLFSRGTPA
jgi:hypothetical protein